MSTPVTPPANGPQPEPAAAPQYAVPQYVAPQYAAPQYAAPQHTAPQQGGHYYVHAGAQPQYAAQQVWPQATGEKTNVLGVVALSLMGVHAIFVIFSTVFARAAMRSGNYEFVMYGLPTIQTIILLAAIGFAVAGVLQATARRARWTAIGALVAGCLGAVTLLGGVVVSNGFYYL